ncbi:Kdo domain containing protein [Hanstruepera neustonica]|uniref:Kdo domain containing protein n=1 Tax=Hanstruepera neustonica TaxID=1445657 RepID=A0A2K1DZ66_9FLAO|nr:lipopolysaccharide kinase InaA family protein [Hanstruepera neustonica]PNQ73322.1 Kdo domain containing protein [Hanstruepera neustonica]
MNRNRKLSKDYKSESNFLDGIIENFDNSGQDFGNQDRNSLKLFEFNGKTINVKSFKIPNVINQIAYRFFRKSKAHRSFEYANKLIELQIGTPEPIAYYEFVTPFLFKNSYYISEHLPYDLTFRELTTDLNFPNHEDILRAFVQFTYTLHEKGINFLDHSPGNTLIQLNNGDYKFFLVDLNRMRFGSMDFNDRMKNLSRLTKQDELIKVMSDEYAKLYSVPFDEVYSKLWECINTFQNKIKRKKELKKKLLFRK